MRQAQLTVSTENLGLTRELLDPYRLPIDGVNYPNWEWRWLWQESRGDPLFRFKKRGKINSLSASHDGKWLANNNSISGFDIWDVSRKEQLFLETAELRVLNFRFSPTQAEFAILSVEEESTKGQEIQIWKTSTMTLDRRWSLLPERRIWSVKYSGNGQYLVGKPRREGSPIDVWETTTGKMRPLHATGLNFDSNVDWAINSDASRIAQGDRGDIVVSDLISGNDIWRKEATYDRVISALTFSPDDETLASGHGFADGSIKIWNATDGEWKAEFKGHKMTVSDLKFGPDGNILFSSSADQTIRVWDLDSREQQGIFRGQGSQVRRIALLPKKGLIAGGGKRNGVTIWDLEKGMKDSYQVPRPTDVCGYGFPDSDRVRTVNGSGEVWEWATLTLKETGWSYDLHQTVESAVFSTRGNRLATLSDKGLMVWDLQSQKDPLTIRLPASELVLIGFDDQARRLRLMQVYDGDHQRIVEWDLTLDKETKDWPVFKGIDPKRIDDRDHTITYLQVDGGTAMFGPHAGGFQYIDCVTGVITPMPDLKKLAPPSSLRVRSNAGWSSSFWDSDFSPDKRHVVFCRDQSGLLCSSDTQFPAGEIRMKEIKGFSQGVHSVAFSPDSRLLALGSVGREAIKLWHLGAQEHILTLPGKGSIFANLSFSPDGNCIAATNKDGLFHLWRAPSWEEIATREEKGE
jgi:WD40 repeat protein